MAKGEEAPQPGASNMKKLVWSTELETVAQRWADQCMVRDDSVLSLYTSSLLKFGHDEIRRKLDGTPGGQNAYMSSSTEQEDVAIILEKQSQAVQIWYNEVTHFNSQNINPFT